MYDPDPSSSASRADAPAWALPRGRAGCVALSRPTLRILERASPYADFSVRHRAKDRLIRAMLTEREGLAGEVLRESRDEAYPAQRHEQRPPTQARRPTPAGRLRRISNVVESAAWLARIYHSARVESAHLLLALLMEGGGEIDELLRSHGIDRELLRRRLVDALGSGHREPVTAGDDANTSRTEGATCKACGRRHPAAARFCGFCGIVLPHGGPAEISLEKARACLAAGQAGKALMLYHEAAAADPTRAEAWIERAACLPEQATIRRACFVIAGLAILSSDERYHAEMIATYRRLAWWQRWAARLNLPPFALAKLRGIKGAGR